MNTPLKIAVIGPTQSGKTCLAVGLFSTSTHGFTIATPNMDDRTYLTERRKEIVGGVWPAANNKGRPHPLRFDFQKKGHDSITVTFPEFAGELLGTDEEFKTLANEHFRDLSGVVLLINPGADAFQKGDARLLEDAKTQYQRILSFLKDPNYGSDKAFVALTVTAADRLCGLDADLKGKDAAFRDCLVEVENSLSSMNFRWKKFFVSMSGPTDADNKFKRNSVPRGFPNTSSRPILWILDKLFRRPIPVPHWLAVVAAALLVAAGVGCWINALEARRFIREEKAAASKELESAGSTAGSCERAFDGAKPRLESLQPGRYGRVWHKGLAVSTFRELEPKAWDILQRCIQRSRRDLREDVLQNPTNCVDRTKGIDDLFAKFHPVSEELRKELDELKSEWDKEKVGVDEQIAIAIMEETIQETLNRLAGKHGDEILRSLLDLYPVLARVNPPEGATNLVQRRAALAIEIDARTAEEFRHIADLIFKAGLPSDKADAEAKTLTEKMSAWTPATDDGKAVKVAMQDSIDANKSESVKKWETAKRKICEDWVKTEIREERPLVGEDGLWTAYRQFARDNGENPYFSSIVQYAVYALAEKAFHNDVAWFRVKGGGAANLWADNANFAVNWKVVNERFLSFRQLCRKVADDKTPLRSSWAWHFAKRCLNDGKIEKFDEAFPRRIVVDWINASANYHGNLPVNYKCTSFAARIDIERFNNNGTRASAVSKPILPFDDDGQSAKDGDGNSVNAGKGKTENLLLQRQIYVDVHAFERAELVLAATDYNNGTWRLSSPRKRHLLVWNDKEVTNGEKGSLFDLSFDLGRWTGDSRPELYMEIRGHVENDNSIDVLIEKAKKDAEAFKSGN